LVNTTVIASTSERQFRKYKLLDVIKSMIYQGGMKLRVVNCMHTMHKHIEIRQGAGGAYYHGVIACGSVWLCPVCASRITESRRNELRQAVAVNDDLLPVMITVTLQHGRQDKLHSLLDALNGSLRKLKAGRWWRSFSDKYGLVASVSSLEIRYSQVTGWHPHKHYLMFLDIPVGKLNVEALKEELTERYTALIAEHGRYASEFHSIDVSIGDSAVASYLMKWSLVDEMSKANVKDGKEGSFSPFQLAELAGSGEGWARHAFIEYAQATFRMKQVSWSRNGRNVLGLGKDASDKELAEVKPGNDDVLIASLSRDQWKQVLRHAVQGELLEVAEQGGSDAVMRFIADISPPG